LRSASVSNTWATRKRTDDFGNGNLTVTRAAVTVADASKVFGQDDSAALTGTISGIQNDDVITAAYFSAGARPSATPGTYAI
jgi:hypothetical protein